MMMTPDRRDAPPSDLYDPSFEDLTWDDATGAWLIVDRKDKHDWRFATEYGRRAWDERMIEQLAGDAAVCRTRGLWSLGQALGMSGGPCALRDRFITDGLADLRRAHAACEQILAKQRRLAARQTLMAQLQASALAAD